MIADILAKIDLHRQRASLAVQEIEMFPEGLHVGIFEEFEKVKVIDTFIYRFIKIQDMMGEKLFRIFLDELGEYRHEMSLIDVLDRLEKLGLLEDASEWMYYRKLRNKLTHEYPSNEDEIIEGISLALHAFKEMETILSKILHYRESRNLS